MKENEIWRDVVGFEGVYEVSNLGRIRKFTTKRPLKPSLANKYAHVTLSRNKAKKTIRVHRIVAKAFIPLVPGKEHVNHKNGQKHDNRVCNLEWVSQNENNMHSYTTLGNVSPMLRQKHTPSNKIKTKKEVLEFDSLNKQGLSTEVIGKMIGVAGSTVRKHLRRLRRGEYDKLE